MLAIRLIAIASFLFGAAAHGAELRGHGGPVRAIAITPDGKSAITGSFDARAIIWSLDTGAARAVLLFHDGQIDAVAALPPGHFASAGADGRIAIWDEGHSSPISVLRNEAGPVVALAVSPDGATLAAASWDGEVRLWPLSGGQPRILEGHQDGVNSVVFLADGTLASAGKDAAVMLWPPRPDTAPVRIAMPAATSTLAATPSGRLFAGGADGTLYEIDRSGAILGEARIFPGPITALATMADGRYIAAAAIRDGIVLLDAETLKPVRTLDTAGMPVWALAFPPDGKTLLAGGADPVVQEWDLDTGKRRGTTMGPTDPMAAYAGNPDAEAFRACIACHTLDPDDGPRAGPTLHGIFGRRIASVSGYPYSAAFREMDIVWTPETVSKLFELGPTTYTPGTKMPEQTIRDPEDRAALIRFLKSATGNK